ncbi:N-acetylmuramoyl-L-alanine amidase family protein [Thalassobellus suaedae]|uniref:N-acetylmuramoyl-L-alanine amidase n=1 Tax=Thalassobellus suaedae TaxID=3074124 RepID=A0ABY9Y204_9FLAO|nr:N-acetylmuramoyl-L-alanine amidase [Flavobacteriaceae bacterium HL-DH14]WNH12091.1 N-acetylmuramoyl-L-alanine amidase [Flavobacteriaceae bacterium HL-DH10]
MKTNTVLLFVSFIIVLTFSSFVNEAGDVTRDKFVVVLDAGHGGRDPGNLGNGYKEKDIALKIVLAIGKELEKNSNIKVVYTRKTDVFIELYERPKIANKVNADLFVSIHCDSHHTSAYGAGTFVMAIKKMSQNLSVAKKENAVILLEDNYEEKYGGFDPNSPESLIGSSLIVEEYLDQSIMAASLIQKNLVTNLKRKDRNVKQDVFWVLHATFMPSVLVETGFLTNKKEGAYLNSNKGQIEIAKQIADGVFKYKKTVESNIGGFVYEDNHEESNIEPERIFNDITFKIQIAASSKKLETESYNFKGLSNISRVKEGSLYKYFYGSTSNYNETKKLADDAKNKGYATCFIVAFKDDKKVSLTDALKTTSN